LREQINGIVAMTVEGLRVRRERRRSRSLV